MNKRTKRHLLETTGLIWLCAIMAAALYFRGSSGRTMADMLATSVLPILPPGTWLQTNFGVIIQAGGTMIAGLAASYAAYWSHINHGLTQQIHIDTNGRLTALVTLLNQLGVDAQLLAKKVMEATLLATERSDAASAQAAKETTAATLAAADKAIVDIAASAAATGERMAAANKEASTQVNMPGAVVTGIIPEVPM